MRAVPWIAAFVFCVVSGLAGEKQSSTLEPVFYRMSRLEDAKKRAVSEGKPIAWIASFPEYLAPHEKLMGKGSHAATAYAIRALQKEAVLIFSDARTENHQE